MPLNRPAFHRSARLLIMIVLMTALLPITAGITGCQSISGSASDLTAAASGTTAATTIAASATTSSPAAETTTEALNLPLNPLTNEPLQNPEAQGQRPVAIMINNIKKALPQMGISQADLIYEMQVEGGITRLMAVFADISAVPEIGSIRSARHDYIDLAGGLDAVLVHIGASDLANIQFSKQKYAHLDLHIYADSYWRDQEWLHDRGYEHSVKTTGERLQAALAKSKYRTEVRSGQKPAFAFRPADAFAAAAGEIANKVSISFSNYDTATFEYDPTTRLYSKGQFGQPHLDLAAGEPLKFTNVLLLMTKVVVVDKKAHKDADLAKGKGYYISGGRWQPINWAKGETEDSFVFTDAQGQELQVNTGKSYIGIVSDKNSPDFKP